MKVAKNLLTKTNADGKNTLLALLELRNTPSQGLDSLPAQRFLNCRPRTLLPVKAKLLTLLSEEYIKHDVRKYCKGPASPNKATTKLLKT